MHPIGVFLGPKPSGCQLPLDPEIQDPKTYLHEDLKASKETKFKIPWILFQELLRVHNVYNSNYKYSEILFLHCC